MREGYLLSAVSTSAEAPIVSGRFRPMADARPKARRSAETHASGAHNVQAAWGAVRGGVEHGVSPPRSPWEVQASQHRRPEACMDCIVMGSPPQWPTR